MLHGDHLMNNSLKKEKEINEITSVQSHMLIMCCSPNNSNTGGDWVIYGDFIENTSTQLWLTSSS